MQQQAVKDYLSQLSTILLDAKGDLRDPQNKQLRILTTATTPTLFREPNLDGDRKGQVIEFLAEMRLVNIDRVYGPLRLEDEIPTISLYNADLSHAILSGAILLYAVSHANLSGADLSEVEGLTQEQVSSALLCRTSLPAQIKLDSERDCEILQPKVN